MLPSCTYSFNQYDAAFNVTHKQSKHIINNDQYTRAQRKQYFRQHNVNDKQLYINVLEKLMNSSVISHPAYTVHPYNQFTINEYIQWATIPLCINPLFYLPYNRYHRKQQQLCNMMYMLNELLQSINSNQSLHIVEFCSSSGHLALLIAFMYPQHTVTLVDRNSTAVKSARQRIIESGLSNINVIHSDILDVDIKFDIGVGLHACGYLSDVIQCMCVQQRASYLICSCCVGKIQSQIDEPLQHSNITLSYPRSKCLSDVLTTREYRQLICSSDYSGFDDSANARRHRLCKQYIEQDRNMYAEEYNYNTVISQMIPNTCTAKNDMIIGYCTSR